MVPASPHPFKLGVPRVIGSLLFTSWSSVIGELLLLIWGVERTIHAMDCYSYIYSLLVNLMKID